MPANVYWLEIKEDGGKLSGHVPQPQRQSESARRREDRERRAGVSGRPARSADRTRVPREDRERQARRPAHVSRRGARAAHGHTAGGAGTQRVVNWIGVRPPTWPRAQRQRPAHVRHARRARSTASRSTRSSCRTPTGRWAGRSWTASLTNQSRREQPRLEGEVPGLQDRGGIQARRAQQQRHLPARPLRAAAASTTSRTRTTRRDFGHMAIYGRTPPTHERQQARRRMADDGSRSSSATA